MNVQRQIDDALDAREWAYSKLLHDRKQMIQRFENHALASNASAEQGLAWYAHSKKTLKIADTFVWTEGTAKAVMAAAAKLPTDVPFHRAWLPVQAGFWWLGRDSPWIARTSTEQTGELASDEQLAEVGICAVSYRVDELSDYVMIEVYTLDHYHEKRGPAVFHGMAWQEGETLPQFLARVHTKQEWWNETTEHAARLVMAACLWLQQKVVAIGGGIGSRGQRKRLKKEEISSTTRIVVLRKYEQEHHDATGTGVPLQYRIPVSGHWRNQPYPSKDCIIPIWIDDHWRGPEGAPEKAPSKIIYRVSR